jgi:uncharacterized membrane protein
MREIRQSHLISFKIGNGLDNITQKGIINKNTGVKLNTGAYPLKIFTLLDYITIEIRFFYREWVKLRVKEIFDMCRIGGILPLVKLAVMEAVNEKPQRTN